ncbi:FKBP-type peptidyl-prolyl cis-trans isomerase [Patescibacteria group bacterium]|nr:FKBP-type peptidyl-prolyl cis-trans isomerase [Patescibacteria group bacterium]
MSKEAISTLVVVVLLIVGVVVILSQKPASLPSGSSAVPTLEPVSSTPAITVNPNQLSVNPTPSTMSQLKIEDLKIGTGSAVKAGDTILINYVGTLLNGQKFDSSYDRGQPFETQIGVGQVIKGWDEGVVGMKVGGKRRLTIPPELAYGDRGAGNVIPPKSTLVFEVELVSIK